MRVSKSGFRRVRTAGKNRRVPSAKMPRNPLFSSAEVNSACGFHSGNGFVSRTLPLLENHFVYSMKGDAFKASPFLSDFMVVIEKGCQIGKKTEEKCTAYPKTCINQGHFIILLSEDNQQSCQYQRTPFYKLKGTAFIF